MELTILGSSSSGNSYVIQNATEALVLEAGINFQQQVRSALDWDVSKVAGCLITHEHMDHAARAHEFLQAHPRPPGRTIQDTEASFINQSSKQALWSHSPPEGPDNTI